MLNITLITIGKIKTAYLNQAALEYVKRIQPYARLTVTELKAESFSTTTKDKAKKIEAARIAAVLERKTDSEVWLLAEHGALVNSVEFATRTDGKELVLVIAGSLGFTKELENKYPQLSLSPLTFPHELARVILLEQIYRAATIINKKEYNY